MGKSKALGIVLSGVFAGAGASVGCNGATASPEGQPPLAQAQARSVRSSDGRATRRVTLANANGAVVGEATFSPGPDGHVTGTIAIHDRELSEGFHAIHLHANDNPDNGKGCIADPDDPPEKHFVSADAHYNPTRAEHGEHAGDLPSVRIVGGGRGYLTFVQALDLDDLAGRALVLHDHRDNFGHVPVGDRPDEYTPNSPRAVELTKTAGHAGHRIACGVVR
jgi:superoxide dismutase, Cu-Zn family